MAALEERSEEEQAMVEAAMKDPKDHQSRRVLADWYYEKGNQVLGFGYEWAARWKKFPGYFRSVPDYHANGGYWYWRFDEDAAPYEWRKVSHRATLSWRFYHAITADGHHSEFLEYNFALYELPYRAFEALAEELKHFRAISSLEE